jgi:hypothetical protein
MTTLPHIEIVVDLDTIKHQLKNHGLAGGIYYSNGSCWWSHHRSHAMLKPGMKCPLDGQIFFEKDWEAWLDGAHDNPSYYGRHGLLALIAAHHSNVRDGASGGPFAAKSWRIYNEALDACLHEERRVG